jgi:hypothetical protein
LNRRHLMSENNWACRQCRLEIRGHRTSRGVGPWFHVLKVHHGTECLCGPVVELETEHFERLKREGVIGVGFGDRSGNELRVRLGKGEDPARHEARPNDVGGLGSSPEAP